MKGGLFLVILVGFSLFAVTPLLAVAQFGFGASFEEANISLNLNPQFPSPFENVSVSVDDYTLGVVGSRISWEINGVVQSQVNNERTINFNAPGVGESTTVSVQITTPDNQTFTSEVVIKPLYTDIIIEPYTYAPALYPGRPLPSFGSRVLLTTIIHDENGPINPASYTYTWTLANRVLNNGPVQGGFQTTITVPNGRNILLGVTVSDLQGKTIARRLITFPSAPVDLQFYEVNPLFGLSHLVAANPLTLIGNSTTIRAVPYNLDVFASSNQLFTEWRIDNRRQSLNILDPFEINIMRSGTGQSEVNFKLRHLEALLQGGERSLTILY